MPQKTIKLPPLEVLTHYFRLSKESPSGLVWNNPPHGRFKEGQVAGTKAKTGYWYVGVTTPDAGYKHYKVHRIIYFMRTGEDPVGYEIDHVSGKDNNGELRKATRSQNCQYREKSAFTNSPYKGVTKATTSEKWVALICSNGEIRYLGVFDTPEEAAYAYDKAALELHGEYAKINGILPSFCQS